MFFVVLTIYFFLILRHSNLFLFETRKAINRDLKDHYIGKF